jgi:UDP-N-acetylglucosamine 4-epimerase
MAAGSGFDQELRRHSFTWLVTGAAGFIGSHLVETLLELNQNVIGLDNYSTGSRDNLADVARLVGSPLWKNFRLIEGDIRDPETCREACQGVDFVFHQAALGSVPLSLQDPVLTHHVNVSGFINILLAAKDASVRRMVYASSCAIYGDNSHLPLCEFEQVRPISPYAASKAANELYAQAFYHSYGFPVVGLRYFNVFGERQDPNGPYAAVIPKWIKSMLNGESVRIHGDGSNTRDFVYVGDVVRANIAAALTTAKADGSVYNVAAGYPTSLNELHKTLVDHISAFGCTEPLKAQYGDARPGDIVHSQASIARSQEDLYYNVTDLSTGLRRAMAWYAGQMEDLEFHKPAENTFLQSTLPKL